MKDTDTKRLWPTAYVALLMVGFGIIMAGIVMAYKWIRILFICWKNNEPYNEKKYIQSLLKYRSPICSYIPHNLLKTC